MRHNENDPQKDAPAPIAQCEVTYTTLPLKPTRMVAVVCQSVEKIMPRQFILDLPSIIPDYR